MSILFLAVVILLIIWKGQSSKPKNTSKARERYKVQSSKPEDIGNAGERCVARKLDGMANEYITLNDVLLPTTYGTTQIDHIVVSPYGIFVIETKNYKGWIFGHQDSEEWQQSLLGNKTISGWSSEQHKFRNPILQNLAHFRTVRTILKDIGDFTIIPIVVFSDDADLNITVHNHTVINWCNLCSTIQSYRMPCISQDNVKRIVDKLTATNITTEGSREIHADRVQEIQHDRAMTIANRHCPKCGGNLVQRQGKFGSFWGCSNYPRCRFTHND